MVGNKSVGEWREMVGKTKKTESVKDGWWKVADKRRLRGSRDAAAAPWSRFFM